MNSTKDVDAKGGSWLGRNAIRATFTILAVALVVTPMVVAWYLHVLGLQVSQQQDTPRVQR